MKFCNCSCSFFPNELRMRRKQLLNFTVTFIFVFAVQYTLPAEGSDLCFWCDERLQDNFVSCLYIKLLSNTVFNIFPPSAIDDMERRLLAVSDSMAGIPYDIKWKKMDDVLAGEMSEMVMSLTSDDSTQNSYYSTMEEAVQLTGKCYSVATGKVNVNFVKNFRNLLQDKIQYRTVSIDRFPNSVSEYGPLFLPNSNQQSLNDNQRIQLPILPAPISQQISNNSPYDETISFSSPNQQGFIINELTEPNIQPVPIPQQIPNRILSFPSNDETLYLSNSNEHGFGSNQQIESPSQPVPVPQKIFEGPSFPSPVLGNVFPNSNAFGTQNNEFANSNFPFERPVAENVGVNQYALNSRQEAFPTNFESISKDNFPPVLNNVNNIQRLAEQTNFQISNDESPDTYSEIESSHSKADTNADSKSSAEESTEMNYFQNSDDSKPSSEESMKISDYQNSNDSKLSAEKSTNTNDDQKSDDSEATTSVNSPLAKFSNVFKRFFKNYNVSKKDIPTSEEESKNKPTNSTVVSAHKSEDENNFADPDENVDNPAEFERHLGTVLSNTISDYETDENLKILISGAKRCISPSGFDFQNYVSIMSYVAESLQKNHPDWSRMKCYMKMYSLTVVAMSHSLQEKIASNIKNIQSEPFLSNHPDPVATQSVSKVLQDPSTEPLSNPPPNSAKSLDNSINSGYAVSHDVFPPLQNRQITLNQQSTNAENALLESSGFSINYDSDNNVKEGNPVAVQPQISSKAPVNNLLVNHGFDYGLNGDVPVPVRAINLPENHGFDYDLGRAVSFQANSLPENHGLDYNLRRAVPLRVNNLPVNYGLHSDLGGAVPFQANNLPVNPGSDYDLSGAVQIRTNNLPLNHGMDHDLNERGSELAQSKIYIPVEENNPPVKYGLDSDLTETGPLSIQSNTRILVRQNNPVANYGLRYDVPATEPMATDSRYGNIQSHQTQYNSDYNSGFGML